MKKILILIACLVVLPVKALELIPSNIYYLDDGLYAYLEEVELDEEKKLYVEYRLTNNDQIKTIDLIEIESLPMKKLILNQDDEFFNEELEIESRFVLSGEEYDYSEWSSKEKITDFSFEEIIDPKISDLKPDLTYKLDNEKEIEAYFEKYLKVKEEKIDYKIEYKFNDSDWKNQKEEFNQEDVKVELRIKYIVGEYESKYSNILIYEKHPEKVCPFDSDLCCNEFANISVCYWIMIVSLVLTGTLIFIDKKKRKNREA